MTYITFNDIIITVTYRTPLASSVNQDIITNNSLMMVDSRILFPYSRFFGKIMVKLDAVLDPGTYIVSYPRYALK